MLRQLQYCTLQAGPELLTSIRQHWALVSRFRVSFGGGFATVPRQGLEGVILKDAKALPPNRHATPIEKPALAHELSPRAPG